MWLNIIVAILAAYFLGNLNGAVSISMTLHDDVRSHGSGNAGLTNFIRTYGSKNSFGVIAIDAGKAVLACLVGRLLLEPFGYGLEGAAIGGLAVMLGHDFPALLQFKGGKGYFSSMFIALSIDWRIGLIVPTVFAIFYLTTRYVSLSSILASITFSLCFCFMHYDRPVVMICGAAMGLLTIAMHHQNIARLLKGQERRTNLFKKDKE